MPRGDHTGPAGAGPRTGRGMGYCTGHTQPGYTTAPSQGQGGFGFYRRGRGRGWQHRFFANDRAGWAASAPQQEPADLQAQVNWLKDQLDAIRERIEELVTK